MKKLLGFLTLSLVASVSFAEDAYIESFGTNCVPINYYTTPNTKYVLDFAYIGTVKGPVIFGGWYGTGPRVGLFVNSNDSFEGRYVDTVTDKEKFTARIIARDEVRHTAILDLPEKKITIKTGDASASKAMEATFDTSDTLPVALFCRLKSNSATDSSGNSTMRFYDLKVYESDELVHHYIPCIRDGLAGVYDTESGDFFTDSRYPLAYGGDIMQFADEDDDAYVSSPNGGVSVETLYKANKDSCFDIDFEPLNDTTTQQFYFETASSGGANICGRLYVSGYLGCAYSYANGGQFQDIGNGKAKLKVQTGARHRAIIDSYNGTVTYYSCGITNACHAIDPASVTNSATQTASTRLFSNASQDTIGNYARMKLYRFKIYEKGVLMHDLVPMKSRGEGVLKDLVTGRVLYSRTSTKLSFGGKIKELPYLESLTTQQCIALDYYANQKTYLEMDYEVTEGAINNIMLAANRSTFSYRMNGTSSGNCEFRCHGAWSGGAAGSPTVGKRYMAIMDMPNSKVDVRSAGVSLNSSLPISMNSKANYTDEQETCTEKLGVFGNDAGYSGGNTGAKMRLYRLTVWEEGAIIHKYEPYVKNGVPGLKDAVNGNFFAGKDATGWTSALTVHGACPYEGAASDAYVESDGTQAVLTDYTPKANSRIEVDFQMLVCADSKYICGSNISTDYWDAYLANSHFRCICQSNWMPTETIACDCNRHLLKLDAYNNRTISITDSTGATQTFAQTGSATGTSIPFAVFARSNDATATTFYGMSRVRIYSVRIYEDDTNLVHEFLPYKSGETVGFYDTVTGEIKTNAIDGANPLTVGGVGVEGSGSVFKVAPQGITIEADAPGVLSAFAPGAVRYVWTKNGETLSGESGANLEIAWRKKKPHQDTFTVMPVYDVFGNEVMGTAASATVEYRPDGMVLLFR